MAMTWAKTRLSMMLSPTYAIVTVLIEHAFLRKDWMTKGLMEHLSTKDEVLTLVGVSPGSGVLHQEV